MATRSTFLCAIGMAITGFQPLAAQTAEDDHGDTAATATTITVPSSTAGVIDWSADLDAFRVEVTYNGKKQ